MCDSFIEAMDDDFNTAGALGSICSFVREANTILAEASVSSEDAATVLAGADAVCDLLSVLGVDLNACEDKECDSSNEVVALAVELAGFTGCDARGPSKRCWRVALKPARKRTSPLPMRYAIGWAIWALWLKIHRKAHV